MKRIVLFLALTLNCFWIAAQQYQTVTRSVAMQTVDKFYRAIQASPNVKVNDYYKFVETNISHLVIPLEVFYHPSDIHPVTNQASIQNCKHLNSYLRELIKLNEDHNVRIDYEVCDAKDLKEIVYRDERERLEPTYWTVSVKKKITIDGTSHSLIDTVDVKISNGKIAFISNRMFRQNHNFHYGDEGANLEARNNMLKIDAAKLWNSGQKKAAYQAYVESVRDVEDPETLFRIGLILLNHRKECTNLKKNEAQDLAFSYFERAKNVGHEDAVRVLQRWWGGYKGNF